MVPPAAFDEAPQGLLVVKPSSRQGTKDVVHCRTLAQEASCASWCPIPSCRPPRAATT
ncbi:hypothetical protein [Streptomyces sp. RB17]|uniref:hypothetical protein n=1 Tax=Streptomyces sp. RB17 TaxID=2585197 RepID=UPI00129749CD|nr:hypothetical protein [Streptomyces sp. RB17]